MRGEDALRELAEIIGDDAALTLARRFGGTSVYVPITIGDHHPLCAALGRAIADKLAAWSGGTTIAVPKQVERRERVRRLNQQGRLTIAAIALDTGYSERHVYRLLCEEDDARQPGLFD